jgi:SAM-dependent methyltransferase
MRVLDVGCGLNKVPGAIGLDLAAHTAADVRADLNRFPYPFADDAFDEVIGRHVVEHVADVMGFVNELYRITRPGGTIKLLAPHYTNPDFPTDPTHRNHLNSYSFTCFSPDRRLFPFYTDAVLRPRVVRVTLLNLWRALGLEWLVNLDARSPRFRFLRKFWEQYLNALVRGKELYFEFEVVKDKGL